jgi:hypothetical protein
MIQVTCDGCGDDTGTINDSDWRTIVVDLGYLPGSRDHGSIDELCSFVLCHLCVDALPTEALEAALKQGLRRD